MNNSKQLVSLSQMCCRQLSKSAPLASDASAVARMSKLKKVQKSFGVDDSVPVYIKSGFGDKLMYQGTTALIAAGVGLSLHTFYKLTFGRD